MSWNWLVLNIILILSAHGINTIHGINTTPNTIVRDLVCLHESMKQTVADSKKIWVKLHGVMPFRVVRLSKHNHQIASNIPLCRINLVNREEERMERNPITTNSKETTIGTTVCPPQLDNFISSHSYCDISIDPSFTVFEGKPTNPKIKNAHTHTCDKHTHTHTHTHT